MDISRQNTLRNAPCAGGRHRLLQCRERSRARSAQRSGPGHAAARTGQHSRQSQRRPENPPLYLDRPEG